jgi:hypothetical protein
MADVTLTASPDDTVAVAPTDAVTVPASLPNAGDLRARKPSHKWMPEEDAKLLEAANLLMENWVQVATLVPGRTNVQCAKRWKNVLHKSFDQTTVQCAKRWKNVLHKSFDQTTAHKKGKWTLEEDERLTEAVRKHAGNAVRKNAGSNWVLVATLVPGRTNKQCMQRWVECLDPAINTGKWTREEDTKLTNALKEHGSSNWAAVAALVPTRTNVECRQRWANNLDPAVNRGKWTAEEDAKLTEAVAEFGNDWVRVAVLFPGRSNKGCCRRWIKR